MNYNQKIEKLLDLTKQDLDNYYPELASLLELAKRNGDKYTTADLLHAYKRLERVADALGKVIDDPRV